MCGIAGIASLDCRDVQSEILERMGYAVRHRGPDDTGVWLAADAPPAVGLANRRLTIIDPSPAGHQPLTNEDGTLWLTYNGEIYNHEELRAQLEAAGHRYHSHTDTETILHAYEEWGDRFVERLRGMFAFALWDARRRRLLLVRDRLGIKPLYYARTGNSRLLFASEIKAILAAGFFQPELAQRALPEYLMFGYLSGDHTMFRHVSALPPGHVLVWDETGVSIRQYWDVTFRSGERASAEETRRQFADLFDNAVRTHMMSDVPVGVFLSGGLDSSAVAAVMKRYGDLKTFSVGFPTGHYSELPYARAVAAHLGAEHHEVVVTSEDFLSSLPRMVWYEDEPIWTVASVAMYHLSRLAAAHVKVVLTGEGSDELFAGYDRYWFSAFNDRLAPAYALLPASVRRVVSDALGHEMIPERIRRALSHTLFCRDLTARALVFDNWFGVFTPAMQADMCSEDVRRSARSVDVYASHLKPFESTRAATIVDRMLSVDVKTNLVELLMKQDRMTMAASLESRVPYLDHHVVEFAARIPHLANLDRFSGKRLLKDTVRDVLPAAIVSRRKQGFPVPFVSWLNNDYFGHVSNLLLDERALARGWFKPEKIRELLAAHRAGRQNYNRQLWALLTLELWARIFLDGQRSWVDEPAEAWNQVVRDTHTAYASKTIVASPAVAS